MHTDLTENDLLKSNVIAEGTDYGEFEKARSFFEDATMYVEIDFCLRPAKILLFDGFDDDYILFIGVTETETKRLKCRKELFPKSIVDEISRREIPYIINVGNLNMLVKDSTLQQLARRLKLSRIKLKEISIDSARMVAMEINKESSRVVLRKCGRMYLFISIYKQNVIHKSMIPVIKDIIMQTGYEFASWKVEQEKTTVLLRGNVMYDNKMFPVIEVTFSDILSSSEEIRFGVKARNNPFVIYTENLDPKMEDFREIIKKEESLLREAENKEISFYANFNQKYRKLVGRSRMNIITNSGVDDHLKASECIELLLYTVRQVGKIPFSTENSLLEVGKELKKQIKNS